MADHHIVEDDLSRQLLADADALRHDNFCNVRDNYPCSCGLANFQTRLRSFVRIRTPIAVPGPTRIIELASDTARGSVRVKGVIDE